MARKLGSWRGKCNVDGWGLLCSTTAVDPVMVLDSSAERVFEKFGEDIFKMSWNITRDAEME